MPQFYDSDDDLEDDEQEPGETPTIAQMRKQIKLLSKQNKDLLAAKAESDKLNRERSIGDVLKEKGIPSKAAKLMPADLDPTPEAVQEWLEEFGDLFHLQPKDSPSPEEGDDEDAEASAAQGRVGAIESNGTASGEKALEQQILAATSDAELEALLKRAAGANSL